MLHFSLFSTFHHHPSLLPSPCTFHHHPSILSIIQHISPSSTTFIIIQPFYHHTPLLPSYSPFTIIHHFYHHTPLLPSYSPFTIIHHFYHHTTLLPSYSPFTIIHHFYHHTALFTIIHHFSPSCCKNSHHHPSILSIIQNFSLLSINFFHHPALFTIMQRFSPSLSEFRITLIDGFADDGLPRSPQSPSQEKNSIINLICKQLASRSNVFQEKKSFSQQ